MRLHRAAILQLCLGAILACDETGESSDTSDTGDTGDTSESTAGADQCMRTIVLGRYHDAEFAAGSVQINE